MGVTLSVETQTLKEGARKISNYADTFENIYKSLLQQAESMGDAYQGDENTTYVEKIKELSTNLNAMTEHLRTASTTLNTQAQNYEDRKNDNIAQIGKLSS